MMKRFIPLFLFLSAIASATAEAAVCGVHATAPDPADAYAFESSKTLVPPSLSGRNFCRNDPINRIDPDGRDDFTAANQDLFCDVYVRSGYCRNEKLEVMSLVFDVDGQQQVIKVDHNSNQSNNQTWSGQFPGELIAIIHSHHDGLDPKPSIQPNSQGQSDLTTAQNHNVPVYNVTNKGEDKNAVYKVTPEGTVTPEEKRSYLKNCKTIVKGIAEKLFAHRKKKKEDS